MTRFPFGLMACGLLLAGCTLLPQKTNVPQAPPPSPPAVSVPPAAAAPVPAAPAPAPEPPAPPPPVPVVSLEPARVLQGDFAVLKLNQPVDGDVRVKVDGLSEQPRVFRLEGLPVAFIGFPAAARVGIYPVRVTWSSGEFLGNVEVVRKAFTEDRLEVSEQLEETYYDPRSDQEWARVFALRSKPIPRPLWNGKFLPPLDGQLDVTTYFGEIRYVNGTETGRHSGMDFGAETGTPIHAPAPGQVILAEKLILSGNTIIIDHGLNLYTAYYHADSLLVKPGDWVETGQVIGKVGSTGFSTGPHLHWTATIGNTPVDPWPLTQHSPMSFLGWSLLPGPKSS